MKTRTISASIFLLLVVTCADAQELNPQLTEVSNALECLRKRDMPQWKRERVEPLTGGKDVLIEYWSSCGRRVKLSFMPYATETAAAKVIQEFAVSEKVKRVEGIGDEAYAWGYSDAIGLRKNNLLVWVSTVSLGDPILRGLEQSELLEYEREDERKVNKSFARILSQMLSELSATCNPGRPYLYKRF
jgi:hypothetical protein